MNLILATIFCLYILNLSNKDLYREFDRNQHFVEKEAPILPYDNSISKFPNSKLKQPSDFKVPIGHKLSRLFYKSQNNALINEKDLLHDLIDNYGMESLIKDSFKNLHRLSREKNGNNNVELNLVRQIDFIQKVAELIPESNEIIQTHLIEYLQQPLSGKKSTKKNQASNRLELLEVLTMINPTEGKLFYSKLSSNWKKVSYTRVVRGLSKNGSSWQDAIEQVDQL